MIRLVATAALAMMAAAIAPPAPAHADDASYLAKLNASGVAIPVPDNVRLNSGHYMCGELRMRATPQELVRQLVNTFFYSIEAAEVQIRTAQSELCPETLH